MHLDKAPFIGQAALRQDAHDGPARQLVGLEIDWDGLEKLYDEAGLPPQIPSTASRVSVPVYLGEKQVGKVTSSTWSPTLKKMIALGSLAAPSAAPGRRLEMEWTVDHQRKRVDATVVKLPFFDPPRKRA